MGIEALTHEIDELVATDPSALGDPESIVALHRQLARLDAVVTQAIGAFDQGGQWGLVGAKSPAAWLAVECRLPKAEATRRVRLAARMDEVPSFASGWREGELSAAHLGVVLRAARHATDQLERDEPMLCDQARRLRFADFCRALAYWEQLADPEGTEERAEAVRTRRDVSLTQSFDGTWLGTMTLDPLAGAIVSGELTRLADQLFELDWAEAKARLGRDPQVEDLLRTHAQRRADALVEMATRSKMAPVDGQRPQPLFSVLVGYETMHGRICELANGTVLSPGSLLSYLDQALIERAVFDSSPRVEISHTQRLFTGATRRAVMVRDRRCTHPYCDTDAAFCQVDHIVPFSEGGPTTQENGRLLCGFHNRLRERERQEAKGRPPPEDTG